MDIRQLYLATGAAVVDLVKQIPDDAWDTPGALGTWDLRGLVGHTGRAFTTVVEYLGRPAERVDLPTAADYLAAGHRADPSIHFAVAARGVDAGLALGDDPASGFAALFDTVVAGWGVTQQTDPVLTTTFGTMRLSEYLVTRIFELVVHGSDIAAAAGLDLDLPDEAVEAAIRLVGDAAMLNGQGFGLLRAITGRDGSPFTVF